MNCDLCKSDAICHIIWGLYEYTEPRTELEENPKKYSRDVPMYEANFCNACSDELWKKIHGSVNMGYMHFVIKPI